MALQVFLQHFVALFMIEILQRVLNMDLQMAKTCILFRNTFVLFFWEVI